MFNKPFLGTIIAALLGSAVAWSQPSAKDIIKEVQKKYENLTNVVADFEQVFHWDLTDEVQTLAGKVWLGTENKYRIETKDQVVVTDGISAWTFSKISNQVVIDKPGTSKDSPLLRDLLLQYSQDYQPRYVGNEKIGENDCSVLELQARTEDAYVRTVTIWVDRKNATVYRIKQIDINGNSNTYTLLGIAFDAKIPAETFKFIKPEGAEVIDMRP